MEPRDEVFPATISGMQDKPLYITAFRGGNVIKQLRGKGKQIEDCDAPIHHLWSRGLDRHQAHRSIVMAHGGPNGRGPHGNSPSQLNLSITSCERLTGEESHSEGQRFGFYREEGEAIDNKGEVLFLYRKEEVISLRKERMQL